MPVMNVIKNDAYGNMLCPKIPCEDFHIGSQLICPVCNAVNSEGTKFCRTKGN